MRRFLLAIASILGLLTASAHHSNHYRTITMDNGLPSNAVRNIVQDRHGYLWMGTDNGLCRYDGMTVLPYRNPMLGTNQYVSALLATDEGLYIGTERGVFKLAYGAAGFEQLPMDITSTVTNLSVDRDGGLWISTFENGVWCYGLRTGQAHHYDLDFSVAQVFIDHDNQVWAVTSWGQPTVSRLNRLHDKFEDAGLHYEGRYESLCMLQTADGQLWLGSWEEGLLKVHPDGTLEQALSPTKDKVGYHIHTLHERSADCICIGCDDGTICYNPKTGQWQRLFEQQSGLSDRFVYAITSDTEGGLWTGSFYGGVNYVPATSNRFEGCSSEEGLSGNVVSRFCEDGKGRLWIASDDGGVMCFLPKTGQTTDYPHRQELSAVNAHALALKDNNLWIGTYTKGVYVLNLTSGRLTQHTGYGEEGQISGSSSYAICHDSQGRTWVATMEALDRYDEDTQRFTMVGKIDALTIDIDEDQQGRLWLSTQGGGLQCYDPQSGKFTTFRHKEKDPHSLPDDQVNCALVDQSERIWVGTANGLCYLDGSASGNISEKKGEGHFTRIQLDVPSQDVVGIVEEQGVLWLTTDRGIVRYQPGQERQVQRFTLQDGMVSDHFQPNAAMKASDGRIFVGTTGGFNYFYPYQIKANTVMPPVYITTMSLLNREEKTAEGLPKDLSLTKEIVIGHGDNRMVTFSFAALSYCSPEKNQYAYRLEGFDRDWNYVVGQPRATYTNLPAGHYTLRVRATNNDGIWSTNEATMRIVITPPFWWSWWAKLLYLLLIAAAIWFGVRFLLKRAEQRHQQELKNLEEKQEKEVREARLNFFTMIAHEIRTPVSLIIGPLENIMKQGSPSDDMRIIDRNAHRLLELVNQLLDFRKVEQKTLVMHFASHDIHELLEAVCERFAPTFGQKGIRFDVSYPAPGFTAIVDREAITKVVSNLLTNANKYTKTRVSLTCSTDADPDHFTIQVADDGIGIRPEDRQRIFEPFFQAKDNKTGTGIGLNIVKNIVTQHHGSISVESEVGVGSTFSIVLPVSQEIMEMDMPQEKEAPFSETKRVTTVSTAPQQKASTLLIVDDSDDMIEFLSNSLKDKYQVLTATDGIDALNVLSSHEVNLIISDWMMPRMDGAELCRQIRRSPMTSHIPFIMLTAKTDNLSKIESMDVGADNYIEKPFSVDYLEACIRNILNIRHHLVEKFLVQTSMPVTEIANNPVDDAFLNRMEKIIEENMSNADLSVNFLAEQLGISRSGLFAKIKSLADITPNEMIMVIRLRKAATLLQEGRFLVSEVGYKVGFSNPSYFSKCFQKQFGMKPGDFIKKAKDNV